MITILVRQQNGFGAFLNVQKLLGIGFFFLLGGIAVAELTPDLERGRIKAETLCASCHNADGNSTVPAWPNIAGLSEKYLIKQLQEYKKGDKGTRFNPVMYSIMQPLSHQDILDLAFFFVHQKPASGSVQEKWITLGEKIYRGGNLNTAVPACGGCHNPTGGGNRPAGFPALSGQHPQYVLDQLKAFQSGTRANDPNGMMRDISKRMTVEEMEAVSNYVSGLHE